jgi:Zn-dependent peptidase ImmA (M78 family)
MTPDDLAERARIERDALDEWIAGKSRPGLGEFRRLAAALKRPLATFLLPEPPQIDPPVISFRAPLHADRSRANAIERVQVRSALRLQRTASWIVRELGGQDLPIPNVGANCEAASAAYAFRLRLGVNPNAHLNWKSASEAFTHWRQALEGSGILVLSLPMGQESARGFSIWDGACPLVAINSAFSSEARIFTLFHECGHLLTRTQSLCVEGANQHFTKSTDKVERWCEQFAADVVLPWNEVETFLREELSISNSDLVVELDVVYTIASTFKVSARAATIILIQHRRATWDLYRVIPASSDNKKPGFGRGGRTRGQLRESQLGKHATSLFAQSVREGLLSRADAMTYLRVSDVELGEYSPRGVG